MPWLFGKEWDAGSEAFSRPVRWALVAAAVTLVAAWVIPYSNSDVVRAVKLLLFMASAVCALYAVPTAVFLLAFRPQYRNHANVVMTLIAAIPFAVAAFVTLIWGAIWVTGGKIH